MTRIILAGFIAVALIVLVGCNSVSDSTELAAKTVVAEETVVKEPVFMKKTYTYKVVGDVSIEADVSRLDDKKPRPVVVYLHGGALINGDKGSIPGDLPKLCREEGYIFISLNYRLAPEVKAPAIIEDVQDAFQWIREQGPKLFNADPSKIVVTGGSAGGYLTMMTGICVEPKPTALVAYWGYGDLDGYWYTEPSEHYRKVKELVSKEEAYEAIGKGVVTGAGKGRAKLGRKRAKYYLYLRQNGWWTKEVTGFDPVSERDKITPYCPVRNITKQYPPIMMVHGTEDTDVPYEKSVDMAKELTRHGVEHELVTVQGAGHGLRGADRPLVRKARDKALEFIKKYMQ